MHASIRQYHIRVPEEMTRRVREGFLPLLSEAPGFVAYYGIVGEEGEWISVTVFDDRSQAEESDRKAAEWIREHLADLLIGPPEAAGGEVVAHEAVRIGWEGEAAA